MTVESADKPWIIAICVIGIAAAVFYLEYPRPSGPWGGTWPGLFFGIAGTATMAYAGVLGARRKYPTMRIGRVQTWMRGHIWLGLLSFPFILFHGGFSMGGQLTSALMILFTVIILSGILGTIIQSIVPRLMNEQLSREIVYSDAGKVLQQWIDTAEQRVESLKPKKDADDIQQYEVVNEFYVREVRPFLIDKKYRGRLSKTDRAKFVFDHVLKLVPPSAQPVVEDLRQVVQQRRDLSRQMRLHEILHAWLLIHVPLSAALLVLTIIHAIMALRYN